MAIDIARRKTNQERLNLLDGTNSFEDKYLKAGTLWKMGMTSKTISEENRIIVCNQAYYDFKKLYYYAPGYKNIAKVIKIMEDVHD